MQPPASPWLPVKICLWAVLAALAVWLRGGSFLQDMKPHPGRFADFFQEWASARNYETDWPIYSEQVEALYRHTGYRPERLEAMLPWNAHPPASVLMALPFGHLDYREAHLAWNLTMVPLLLASLILIFRSLRLPFHVWSIFPVTALVLICAPLLHQFVQGQLNIVLLFLITLSWVLERNDRSVLAGVSLGLAAALKLFPAFLFLYFLMRGRWLALLSGGLAFLALNGLALLLFGAQTFRDYVEVVLPSLQHYRSSWANLSLTGFWLRIFYPELSERVIPLYPSPLLAQLTVYGSQALVTGLTAYACWKSKERGDPDKAFAVCLTGLMLVSPIAWSHYFILLCLPIALLWRDTRGPARWWFYIVLLTMWIPANLYYLVMGKEAFKKWDSARFELPPATPVQNLTIVSLLTYCLVSLFILCLLLKQRQSVPSLVGQAGEEGKT